MFSEDEIKSIAQQLQRKGRNGDKILAHIMPEEAELLEDMGGSGTVNPETGLLEFFSAGDVGNNAGRGGSDNGGGSSSGGSSSGGSSSGSSGGGLGSVGGVGNAVGNNNSSAAAAASAQGGSGIGGRGGAAAPGSNSSPDTGFGQGMTGKEAVDAVAEAMGRSGGVANNVDMSTDAAEKSHAAAVEAAAEHAMNSIAPGKYGIHPALVDPHPALEDAEAVNTLSNINSLANPTATDAMMTAIGMMPGNASVFGTLGSIANTLDPDAPNTGTVGSIAEALGFSNAPGMEGLSEAAQAAADSIDNGSSTENSGGQGGGDGYIPQNQAQYVSAQSESATGGGVNDGSGDLKHNSLTDNTSYVTDAYFGDVADNALGFKEGDGMDFGGSYLENFGSKSKAGKSVQSEGRFGDTVLAYISPEQAKTLKNTGGSGTINPTTGLPEFFNPDYYLQNNSGVKKAVEGGNFDSAQDHWNQFGQKEGRKGSAPFDSNFYLDYYEDVANAIDAGQFGNAKEHWDQYGWKEGRYAFPDLAPDYDPSPGGDRTSTPAPNPSPGPTPNPGPSPAPSPAPSPDPEPSPSPSPQPQQNPYDDAIGFNQDFYLKQNEGVADAVNRGDMTPWEHWTQYGRKEGRQGDGFNNDWYLEQNPGVADAVDRGSFDNALQHWLEYGIDEGRYGADRSKDYSNDPFDKEYYLEQNPDVLKAVEAGDIQGAQWHWDNWGQYEGRRPSAGTQDEQPTPETDDQNPLRDFLGSIEEGVSMYQMNDSLFRGADAEDLSGTQWDEFNFGNRYYVPNSQNDAFREFVKGVRDSGGDQDPTPSSPTPTPDAPNTPTNADPNEGAPTDERVGQLMDIINQLIQQQQAPEPEPEPDPVPDILQPEPQPTDPGTNPETNPGANPETNMNNPFTGQSLGMRPRINPLTGEVEWVSVTGGYGQNNIPSWIDPWRTSRRSGFGNSIVV